MSDLISRSALIETIVDTPTQSSGYNPVYLNGCATRQLEIIDIIESMPAIEAVEVKHGEWIEVHEHMWKRDEYGEIDIFAWESGYHNGPRCELCGYKPCIHCKSNYENTECDEVSYKCSVCGAHKEAKTDFCPECGADMRKGGAK